MATDDGCYVVIVKRRGVTRVRGAFAFRHLAERWAVETLLGTGARWRVVRLETV